MMKEQRRGRTWACVVGVPWVVGVALLALPGVTADFRAYPDLKGDYCKVRRPSQCCADRYDECAVPIRGTLCYCDDFCDRSMNPDCCPDFWNVCRGGPEQQTSCKKEDVAIPYGRSYKFNCNECKCQKSGLKCEEDVCLVEPELVERINRNSRQYGWRASNYSMFWGRKANEGLTLRTGTRTPGRTSMNMYPILLRPVLSEIPDYFDARQKPEWQGRVSGISDQGWCGSSWAFSTLGVAQDRLSIDSDGNETVILSQQHLLSCDRRFQRGCQGGHVERAWQFLRKIGTVNEECFPYRSGTTVTGQLPKIPPCPRGNTLATLRCASSKVLHQRKDFYHTEPAYRISGKEEDIQWEILRNGPVQAIMVVHRDLFLYKAGVYTHTGLEGTNGGGPARHSVRIIGWGEDRSAGMQPTRYWLVANSWGRNWGENGFFRIRRGTNESEIETFILTVHARLDDYSRRGRRVGKRKAAGATWGGSNKNHRHQDKDQFSSAQYANEVKK